MRLHHLEVTAFGPFAGTETVDFDSLNDAGLFLLSGATGAGKTSILDAVCFALYGSVPGARGVKALKSQHAADTTRPEVVLEFSVRERRFVVRRSPEWTRPKRRGTGVATEKAAASLVEVRPDGEHFLTSRAAEVGLLVSGLVGMQAAQFQQVAMLPQGDFQRFLQASSQERHDVLQHLFQTDRFARIEDWMQDHCRQLRDASADGESAVRRLLHLVSGRAERDLPEELAGDSLAVATADGAVAAWTREVLEGAERDLEEAAAAHQAATAADEAARAALEELRRAAGVRVRRDDALRLEEHLSATADRERAAREALETHGRADSCLPVVEMLESARTHRQQAVDAWQSCLETLARLEDADVPGLSDTGELTTAEALTEAERAVTRHLSRLEALLPRVAAVRDARSRQAEAEVELAATTTELAAARSRLADLPARHEALRLRLVEVSATAARREALALKVTAAEERRQAADLVPAARRSLVELEDGARDARDRAADARDRVQDLQARRLAGIAAELAGRLEDGAPCTVCGSPDHPAPAAPDPHRVTEAAQTAADQAYDAAQAALLDATQRVADARHHLESLVRTADGRDVAAAAAELRDAATALAEAEAAESERLALEREKDALAEEERLASADVAELGTRVATLDQALAGHVRSAEEALAEIAHVLGDRDPGDLETQVDRLGLAVRGIESARAVLADRDRAVARLTEAEDQAARTFAAHGFDSDQAVRRAVLDDATRAGHESLLAERADQAARVRAVLSDPEVLALTGEESPDLAAVEGRAVEATELCRAATRSFHVHEQRVHGLQGLLPQLAAAVAAWAPVRDDFVRAESMSKLVRGMGGDNHLQMRLSAYVLARRLDQVLDAANERLSHMRDQRYLLQRTARAARKGAQAGLGLEVLDQWTGDLRDPATLSGGETFVVSLALALGLADVVTQESGGTEIETLFVDEGFGTLDPETLDDVMDRLDGLRAGGRTVGVVSHVSELRTRIPTQVHVRKTPSGSSVHATTLVS